MDIWVILALDAAGNILYIGFSVTARFYLK